MEINHGPWLISFLELISLNGGRRGVYGIHLEFNLNSLPKLQLISIPYGNQFKFLAYAMGTMP